LRNDSVLTANKSNALVGELLDVNVGKTTAESYFQLSPLSSNPSTPITGAIIDSLVLTSAYGQFYGTADGRQALELWELNEGFQDDKAYYAESPVLATGAKLGETTFKTRYIKTASSDSVLAYPWVVGDKTMRKADSVKVLAPLRFLIKTGLKETLFAAIGTADMASATAFQAKFKGVVIRPVGPGGAIVNLAPASAETKMVLYYKVPSSTDSLRSFTFSLGSATLTERHFSRIVTDYTAGDHLKKFATAAPSAHLDTVAAKPANGFTAYLQGGLELGVRLALPELKTLRARKGRIAINRAELIVPVKQYAAGVYPVLGSAYLAEVDANNRPLKNNNGGLRTVQANGSAPTGSNNPAIVTYDASLRAYRVQITTYFDAWVNDKLLDQKGEGFLLLPTLPGVSSLGLSRALIDGGENKIKLKVYYSELN
jgi:hypothetical protein